MAGSEILCIGEILWDSLPMGLFLGGAPFNVASHLHVLGKSVGIISRVGNDRLGEEALARLTRHGLAADLVQVDPELPTGFVKVTLAGEGIPEYEIVEPAAWDAISVGETLLQRARAARMIVFGSLAQRTETTRSTIRRLCETDALKVFDVNLRPPYDDREIVRESLRRADIVKLNDQELERLGAWFGLSGDFQSLAGALAESFDCRIVCVTRGERGAAMWREGAWSECSGISVEVRDTVGAGDAFLAAFLAGLLDGKDGSMLLEQANLLGANVATQEGAVPAYDRQILESLEKAGAGGVFSVG